MDLGESILDNIEEEDGLWLGDSDNDNDVGNVNDVEMMDVEEGEVLDGGKSEREGGGGGGNINNKNNRRGGKKKRKKNKNKKRAPAFDLDSFVLGVGKQLRERKTYLIYSAVGVLGVDALSDLVKEVLAVQACGGQLTAEGNRFRTGGGVLWNVLKKRDPNAYKEIMKKGREFEKQFRRPAAIQAPRQSNNEPLSAEGGAPSKTPDDVPENDSETKAHEAEPSVKSVTEDKRKPVLERIRVPVSYDDLVCEEPTNGSSS